MTIALVQLFFQVRTPDTFDINIGYPYRFFFFSIDGNGLQGSYAIGFVWNFVIAFPIIFLWYFIPDFMFTRSPSQNKMIKYKVFINGKNFKFNEVNGIMNSGFYTNVFVESENEELAESIAVALLQEDEELLEIVVNEPDDLPIFTVLEIEILKEWPNGASFPRTSFDVYDEIEN